MKTFKDLKFNLHPSGEGKQAVMIFPNGYGVSVVRFKISALSALGLGGESNYGSYTHNETEWELAVIKGTEKEYSITYDTSVTDDVIGHLTEKEVSEIIKKVQELKK